MAEVATRGGLRSVIFREPHLASHLLFNAVRLRPVANLVKTWVMFVTPPFRDRIEAGQRLAQRLKREAIGGPDVLVLALPCGGVPVGFAIAHILSADLDIFLVR